MPPPGWVEPAPQPFAAPERPAGRGGSLRAENRRYLDNRRAVARLLDWLLVFGVAKLANRGWGDVYSEFALFQCLLLIYNHLFEVTTGATLGKRMLGLRVANLDDGGLPSPRQAATRGVIGIVEIGVIAAIAVVANKQRRRLGDYAAGTAVVDARRHPVASRSVFRGAIAYPVVWLIPTLVVCATASGRTQDAYRASVNRLCAKADADLAPTVSYMGPQGVPGVLLQRNQLIATRDVPGAWQARHRQLLVALTRQAEAYRILASSERAAAQPQRFAAVAASETVRLPGYESC